MIHHVVLGFPTMPAPQHSRLLPILGPRFTHLTTEAVIS